MDRKAILKKYLCKSGKCPIKTCRGRGSKYCLFWGGFIEENIQLSSILVLYPHFPVYEMARDIAKEKIRNGISPRASNDSICFSCKMVE